MICQEWDRLIDDWLWENIAMLNLRCNVIIVQEQFSIVNQWESETDFTNEHMFHKFKPNFFLFSREELSRARPLVMTILTNFQLCTTALMACMSERKWNLIAMVNPIKIYGERHSKYFMKSFLSATMCEESTCVWRLRKKKEIYEWQRWEEKFFREF